MKGFLTGMFLGAVVGAACGTFLTPGGDKNVKVIRSEMSRIGK